MSTASLPCSETEGNKSSHLFVLPVRICRTSRSRGARPVGRRRRHRAGQGHRQTVKTANADRGERSRKKHVWKATWRSVILASRGQTGEARSDYKARRNSIAEIDLCLEIAYRQQCGKTGKNVFPACWGKLEFLCPKLGSISSRKSGFLRLFLIFPIFPPPICGKTFFHIFNFPTRIYIMRGNGKIGKIGCGE